MHSRKESSPRPEPVDTAHYRNAPSGIGPLADTWRDKPHRLVYDLCAVVDALYARPEPVAFAVYNEDGGFEYATESEREARADWAHGWSMRPLYAHPSAAAGAVTEDEIDDMVDAAVESLALAAGKAFRAGHSFMASPRDVRQAMASALVAIASRTPAAPVAPVVPPTFSTPRDPLPPPGATMTLLSDAPVVTEAMAKPQFFAYDESYGRMVGGTFTPIRVERGFWSEQERNEWIAYRPYCRGITAASEVRG